ncbi:MAG TPA: PilN domain-containing protein [Candidatus Saccharimonadales bacterium]|jgi:Tfp pilus assembly protein PilN
MINLLPTELREQYIYARRNSRLRNWALGMLFGLAGVGIVATAGMLYMQQSINSYSGKVSMAEINLREQKLEETRKHSAEITSSLKLMEQVLSRQVLFSELLTQVASVMPPQTSLTDLSISNIQGSLDITAVSSNYRSATQLQVNLEDPANKIFSKADIQNISCSPGPNTTAYPCTVTIKALFAKDNPFLFINKSSGGAER